MQRAGGLVSMAALAGAATLATGEEATGAAAATDEAVFFGRHLLAVPIEVLPGLFVKRFIVVNTPDDPGLGCLTKLILGYELADKPPHRVAARFRPGDNAHAKSLRQASSCPRGEW
jgi:hypothetical protein